MTELERLTKLITSAMYWGADTPEKIAERLIDGGDVIVPPCKAGDTVYCIAEGIKAPLEGRVRSITVWDSCYAFTIAVRGYYAQMHTDKDFGHTVFLSREEAEVALTERR